MHFKQACRNNKVIVGNEAWATSLECIRIDVYRSLTPYLAGFCTTHRDLFCMHSAVVYVSVLFGNDLYGLLNVWLPATGKYSCYGKVICGFMNACVPNSPSKTKRLRKLCQRMPCWLQVKHDSFKASRKKYATKQSVTMNFNIHQATWFSRRKLLSVTTNKLTSM